MPSAVGLEISENVVRALELDGTERRQRARRFVEVPLEVGAKLEDALPKALDAVFRQHRFPRANVVVSLDSSLSIIREVAVPFVGDDQIRKTLKFNLEAHVHSHEIEDLIVDYYAVEQREKTTQLVVAAIPKSILATVIAALAKFKVDPVAIDLDLFALFNATTRAALTGETGNALVLALGARFTKILSLENGALRAARFLRLTMNGEALGAVDSLVREINRFLLARPVHEPLGLVFITGDCDDARFNALSDGLRGKLGLEVKSIDARARLEHGLDEDTSCRLAASGGVALGLALKGLGLDDVGVDFRQEEFIYQRRFDAIKKSLFLCLTMLAILLGQVALYYHNQGARFEKNRKDVFDKELEIAQTTFTEHFPDEKFDPTRNPVRSVKEAKQRLSDSIGKGDNPLPVSALEYWREVFSNLPAQFTYLTIEKFKVDLNRDKITFSGKVDDRTLAEKVKQQLNTYPAFKAEISSKGLQQDKDTGKFLYEIEIDIKKPAEERSK